MSKLKVRFDEPSQTVEVAQFIPGTGRENTTEAFVARLTDYNELVVFITSLENHLPAMKKKEIERLSKVREEHYRRREELRTELERLNDILDRPVSATSGE